MAATGGAWLPGPDGTFHRPAELSLDDLPPTYKRDEALAKALRMIQPVVAEASRQLGLPPEVLWGLSAHPDLVATIELELRARAAAGRSPEGDEDNHDAGLPAGRSWPPRPGQIGAQPLTPRTSTDPPPALTQLSITQLKLLHETLSHLN